MKSFPCHTTHSGPMSDFPGGSLFKHVTTWHVLLNRPIYDTCHVVANTPVHYILEDFQNLTWEFLANLI